MKKIYFLPLCLIFFDTASSQTYSGQLLAGGNFSITKKKEHYSVYTYTLYNINLAPSAGVFVMNNLAAGFRLNYSRFRTKSESIEQRLVTQIFSYSPFIRYYFLNPTKKINLFVDGSYNFLQNFETVDDQKTRTPGNGFTVFGGPVVFISESIAVEATIGYKHANFEFESGDESTIYSSLGFQIHFGKVKKENKK